MDNKEFKYLSGVQMKRLSYDEKQKYLTSVIHHLEARSEDDNESFDDDDIDPDYVPINDDEESDVEVDNVIPEINDSTDSEADDENLFVGDIDNIDNGVENNPDLLNEFYIGKDGTKWRKNRPNLNRLSAQNVIRESMFMGPNPNTKNLNNVDTFCEIFNKPMQTIICKHTNRKANQEYNKYNVANPDKKPLVWESVQEEELLAYIGILIVIGTHKSNYEPVTQLWKKNAYPLYRATMSVRRFYNITRFIRFDFDATRQMRMETDKAAPISEIFDMLNSNLLNNFRPYQSITVDEQLYPFRGRTKFTQYIPSKPAKYGIKLWWACDSETAYPLNGQIYTGKIGNLRDKNQGERVVKELIAPYKYSGRNVTTDNFFTSLPLAKDLLESNLSIVGTMKKNKTSIPEQFKASRTREVLSSTFGFGEKSVLCSYVPKPNKSVILLSTQHSDDGVSGSKQKPDIILYYNSTKGAVDSMDKMLSQYTTKRKTNRWPLAMFFNIVDIAALAAYIIYTKNHPSNKTVKNYRRRQFLEELGDQFCIPLIKKRALNRRVVQHFAIRSAIQCVLGVQIEELREPNAPFIPDQQDERDSSGRLTHKGQCFMCYREEKKKRSTRKACVRCCKPICQEHSLTQTECQDCHMKN